MSAETIRIFLCQKFSSLSSSGPSGSRAPPSHHIDGMPSSWYSHSLGAGARGKNRRKKNVGNAWLTRRPDGFGGGVLCHHLCNLSRAQIAGKWHHTGTRPGLSGPGRLPIRFAMWLANLSRGESSHVGSWNRGRQGAR